MDLSVVIVAPWDIRNLASCIGSLTAQRTKATYEVIAAVGQARDEADEVAAAHPQVEWITSRERRTPGELRNAAIGASRGAHIAFLHVNCTAPHGWVDLVLETHREHAAPIVCGPIRNGAHGSRTASACFFFERNIWFSLAEEGWVENAPAVNLSYSRHLLQGRSYSDLPFGSDLELHRALGADQPQLIYFNPMLVAYYHGPDRLIDFLAYCYYEGRKFAATRVRSRGWSTGRAVVYAALAWAIPPLMLLRTLRAIPARAMRTAFLRSALLVGVGWEARAVGEGMVYLQSTVGADGE